MVVMVSMLGVALIGERLIATCWQTSISAYYYTTAHSIFVAGLCTIGALFIVYEGSSDTEDALLNLAGILAFVVAMVPTSRPDLLCGSYVLPKYEVTHMITNNVWSVVIALGTVQALYWTLARRSTSSRKTSPLGIVTLVVFWAVMIIGLTGLIFFRKQFDSIAHYAAAVTMFVAIIATVGITAFLVKHQDESKSRHRRGYYRWYASIAAAMIGTLLTVIALHFALDAWNHWIIAIEALLILEFAAYWAIQTIELWNTPNRNEMMSEKDKALLAEGRTPESPAPVAPAPSMTVKPPRAERVLRAL
jgi:uncharacterized membrane protein (UPF0136 family)